MKNCAACGSRLRKGAGNWTPIGWTHKKCNDAALRIANHRREMEVRAHYAQQSAGGAHAGVAMPMQAPATPHRRSALALVGCVVAVVLAAFAVIGIVVAVVGKPQPSKPATGGGYSQPKR